MSKKEIEKLDKEKLVKSLKESIRVEINELKRLNDKISITTLQTSMREFEMTANRIKFCIRSIYDGIY